MYNEVITHLDQVTPEWLTAALVQSGALTQGAVEAITMDANQRELSTSARLHLRYTSEAQGNWPQRLFLKIVHTDMEDEFFGPSEVYYYTRDYIGLQDAPILRCYHAAFSAEQQCYHILMDDISGTHVEVHHKTPTPEYGFALAEALAKLHAHCWGSERLLALGEPIPSAQAIERFVEVARPGADYILPHCIDELAPHWPQAIYEFLEWHPQAMIARTTDSQGFTVIHGDVNPGNVFAPKQGDRPLFIVDRQPFDWSLTTWLGVYDLAYAIIPRWQPPMRRQWEQPIVRHYHVHLQANGVSDYTWEELWADYRLSAAINIYVAIEWCRSRYNEETRPYWLPMLQKSMTAFDDLGCGEH